MAKFYAKAPNGDDAILSISVQAFTQNLAQNGWCKLPNGLIFQWEPTELFCKKLVDFSLPYIALTQYMLICLNSKIVKIATQTQSSCNELMHKMQKVDTNFGFMSEKIANFSFKMEVKLV